LSKLKNKKGGWLRLWLPVGMVIPYAVGNEVHRLRIRRPEMRGIDIRYYAVPGSGMSTMILRPEARAFVVVESELDAILLDQEAGDLAGAVAVGSSSAKPDEYAFNVLRSSLHILVALDFDAAGAKAWKWWRSNFPDCERWPVPKGKDPGEAYKAGVNLRAWIKAGLPTGLQND